MNRFTRLEQLGLVRFRVEPDDFADIENLAGDCFNPEVNTDVDPETLISEKQEFISRVNHEGVWGIIGEYNIGKGWEHGDSVWGFVVDEFSNSGYDDDVRNQTVSALRDAIRNRCRCCMGSGRKI